jgi:hypothetical protein
MNYLTQLMIRVSSLPYTRMVSEWRCVSLNGTQSPPLVLALLALCVRWLFHLRSPMWHNWLTFESMKIMPSFGRRRRVVVTPVVYSGSPDSHLGPEAGYPDSGISRLLPFPPRHSTVITPQFEPRIVSFHFLYNRLFINCYKIRHYITGVAN